MEHVSKVFLVGKPNAGKTSLFNALTGMELKTGNYTGVTVEIAYGFLKRKEGKQVMLMDLPGAYTLTPESPDEAVLPNALIVGNEGAVDLVVIAVDATRLSESLYLALEVIELGYRCVIALTQCDIAQNMGITLDHQILSTSLGCPVIPTSAKKQMGVNELKAEIFKEIDAIEKNQSLEHHPYPKSFVWYQKQTDFMSFLTEAERKDLHEAVSHLIVTNDAINKTLEWGLAVAHLGEAPISAELRLKLLAIHKQYPQFKTLIEDRVQERYQWLDQNQSKWSTEVPMNQTTMKIDQILLHPLWGSLVFFGLMGILFQLLFRGSEPFVAYIEDLVAYLNTFAREHLPNHFLTDLFCEGVINGVGNVIVFLPQILILFTMIGLMEDSGYMARISALMDGVMKRLGLNGRAFVPLISGFVCAVPAIMATRTLPSRRDRLLTMLVLPLMTCSARLPVYSLLIAVLIPNENILGFLSLPALVLLGFYVLASLMSILMMGVFSQMFFKNEHTPPLLLELPDYRMPSFKGLGKRVFNRAKIFLEEAGTVILAGTIVLWLLLAFPTLTLNDLNDYQKRVLESQMADYKRDHQEAFLSEYLIEKQKNPGLDQNTFDTEKMKPILEMQLSAMQKKQSFAGIVGQSLEPLIKPMGWDWQIAVGIIGAFAAREVFVSTLGIVYGVGADVDEESEGLRAKLQEAKHRDGSPVFTVASGMALMVFFAFACQCLSTLAVIRRESGSFAWTGFVFGYMTFLAYFFALFTYHVLS